MLGILAIGFLIGMAHALEADHLAAMGGLVARDNGSGWRGLVVRGCAWGLGHTITLFIICGLVLVLGANLTATREAQLEFAVGVMLVGLGCHVIWRLWRDRVHFNLHLHLHARDQSPHFHAHSHKGASVEHQFAPHTHAHKKPALATPLMVGLMHGMAGSAGLLALAAAGTQTPTVALGYVFFFGLGSVLGMGLLSFVAFGPLKLAERSATLLHRGLIAMAGFAAIGVGTLVMSETALLAFHRLLHA